MIPLSKKQSAERVRRAKTDRDKRCHHSPLYYEWLHYNVFITTVGKDIWSTTEVAKAYGVRWQIEIVFKSWKSGFRMQNLLCEHCDEEYRVKTSIYLLLFFMCLFMQKVYMHYRDKVEKQTGKMISLLKLSALFFTNMLELLFFNPKRLTQHIALYSCYEKRKDRTNMVEFIKSFKN